jgi:superfamily II DNA/RNA helicase
MRFNPIDTAKKINETYRDYMKSTFFINDEELRKKYFAELDKLNFASGPYLECVDAFTQGKSLQQLVAEGLLSPSFKDLLKRDRVQYERPLFLHQEQAIRVADYDKNMVVTTGTGSGKTECFLYPILDHLLKQDSDGTLNPGVRVLLLYPMNALANDQMQRLREILRDYPSITFGAYTGETENEDAAAIRQYQSLHSGEKPLKNERVSRRQMKESPPHILVTNYAMLEYLLIRPTDNVFFDDQGFNSNWKYIVLDEAHVYAGASGMEVSILLRRLIHRLPHSETIRFILTSATLGDIKKNKEILQFASSLCAGRSFDVEAIIRASRRIMEFESSFTGDEALYQTIADIITKEQTLLESNNAKNKQELLDCLNRMQEGKKWIQDEASFQEALYDIFCHDTLYSEIRKHIVHGAKSLQDMIDACSVSETALLNFIQIANFAVKNHGKLLDARYHHFVRTLEGAYVSFFPEKTLSLVPRKTVHVEERDYRCFKLSVCQFCGEMYFEGTISDDQYFIQQEGEKKQFFMVIKPDFLDFTDDDDQNIKKTIEKRKNTYRLCTSCGKIGSYGSVSTCSCNQESSILLYLCRANENDGILHTCYNCRTTNPKGSILRGFYLGQDASAAVVGETLYESIPETITKQRKVNAQVTSNPFKRSVFEEEPKKTRRLLLFSDSRQEAAYFASYFQYTYDVILNRRLIMRSARTLMDRYPGTYEKGIPLLHLIDEMCSSYSEVFGKSMSPAMITKEVYKAIIGELKDLSRNSLHSIGWIDYQITEDLQISQVYDQDGFSLTTKELNSLIYFFLEYCMHHGALQLPENVKFDEEDWSAFDFSKKEPLIQKQHSGTGYSGGNLRAFVPTTQNALTEFIGRVFLESIDIHKGFLSLIFDQYLTDDEIKILVPKPGKRTYFKINPENIKIFIQGYHSIKHYRCSTCGRITTLNINGNCPSYRCDGHLEPYDFNSSKTKEYFINQYGIDAPLIPLTIKEHTAQLSKSVAQEYQHQFIEGKINILSCSTTFEMGVDVGELETVFMKNVPPRPSNYIQRAGRAGRRLNSVAFSLTFCKLGPHDFYYFKKPTDMINGTITPPVFKIDNPKIVKRHVFAVLLSYYWREYFADKKQIQDFLSKVPLKIIDESLRKIPESVMQYLYKVVPTSLTSDIGNFIQEYREELLPKVSAMYQSDVDGYSMAREEEDSKISENKNYKLLDWLRRVEQTYQQEQILSFYSRNNLIPKYGFPVDTVTLFTEANSRGYRSDTSKLSLQRDLTQAISEYAPESEVVADGYMFTSRFIKPPVRQDTTWRQYLVLLCDNPSCNKVKVEKYVGQDIKKRIDCPVCSSHSILPQIMLVPEYGFIIDQTVEKVTTKRPMKTHRTEFYYLGEFDDKRANTAKQYKLNGIQVSVISSPDDELLVMNKSEFLVCQTCGYAKLRHGKTVEFQSHDNPKGYTCKDNQLVMRSLGHKFKTDVALFSIDRTMGRDESLTILYALLEGCSKYFDIERDDIDGCISYQSYAAEGGNIGTTFVLFDSVPGGAGNVKRIYDSDQSDFMGFLQKAFDRVNNCNCGNEGDTVCYSCLCNFRNQHYQESMQRRYAIEFLGKLLE